MMTANLTKMFKSSLFSIGISLSLPTIANDASGQSTTFYKWTDSNGDTSYGYTPPAAYAEQAVSLTRSNNENTIQALSPREIAEANGTPIPAEIILGNEDGEALGAGGLGPTEQLENIDYPTAENASNCWNWDFDSEPVGDPLDTILEAPSGSMSMNDLCGMLFEKVRAMKVLIQQRIDYISSL